MRYLLGRNRTLIVRGPATLRLLGGEATALSAPLENRKIVVRQEKQLPIETTSEADLDVVMAESGSLFEIDGSTIPESWHSALDVLMEMEQGKVVIVGAQDVGKSTLCTFLANSLLKSGIMSRLVDADIGQADIGPPTTLGKATAHDYVTSLSDLSPLAMIFVGDTSPNRVQSRVVDGIRLLANAEERALTFINTDGWVLDPEAITYKVELIKAAQPDLVLGITTGQELESILSGTSAVSMRIDSPMSILARSRSDRRQLRRARYRRFLDGGKTAKYRRRETRLKLPNGLKSTESMRTSELRNLIVGLLDDQGYLLQIGILQSLDEDSIGVYSRPSAHIGEIELGNVRLSKDGVELGYLEL
jgi:polynucleotide 5'-hydroxyl-kinase GRC3/NOL9